MTDTAMSRAVAAAEPATRTKIRMVTYSRESRSLAVYFADNGLLKRRFVATLESPNRVRLDEVDVGGSVCRIIGGAKTSNAVIFSMRTVMPAERESFTQKLTITSTWAHGKLSYNIDLPLVAETVAAQSTTAAGRMPRLETLRNLLGDLRRLERETPYRLERDSDGVLEFVARIK